MLEIKRLSDYTFKHRDIDKLTVQLLDDKQPYKLSINSVVNLLVADDEVLVVDEPMTIIDYENGIVQFTVRTIEFGVGEYKCEYVVTDTGDNSVHLTFPDNGYDAIKITPSLRDL